MTGRQSRLKAALDELRRRTDFAARASQDPVAFPRRFRDPDDIEVAAALAAFLAFGKAAAFIRVLERLSAVMGPHPASFVDRFEPDPDAGRFGSGHRWTRPKDIAAFVWILKELRRRHGSLGALFARLGRGEDADVGPALERFAREARCVDTSPVYGSRRFPRGLASFFAPPSKGSSCKRLNLLLRWMVRPDDGLDFGLWKGIPPAKLVIPLDTHVLRIGRYLGLTRRKSPGWAAAKDVTEALRRLEPADPLRFDFPICHHGMSGACPVGRAPEKCRICPLLGECAKGRALTGQRRPGPANC